MWEQRVDNTESGYVRCDREMSKTLLVIGAGGHGHVVAETAIACGYIPSFLDDNSWMIFKR